MKNLFGQVTLDENNFKLCSFDTSFRRYSFENRTFGASCAPELVYLQHKRNFTHMHHVSTSTKDLLSQDSAVVIWNVPDFVPTISRLIEISLARTKREQWCHFWFFSTRSGFFQIDLVGWFFFIENWFFSFNVRIHFFQYTFKLGFYIVSAYRDIIDI